jgi:sec-independent protein translocase protein TatA
MTDGPFAWIMIVVALLLIFGGGKRLPEIGRGLGAFLKEFKKAQKDEDAPASPEKPGAPAALPKGPDQDEKPQA